MRVTRCALVALVFAFAAIPGTAQAAQLVDGYNGPLTLNLQATDMTFHVPLQFARAELVGSQVNMVPADADTWEVQVIEPGSLGGGTGIVTPEHVLAQLAGSGHVPDGGVDVPVIDQEVRWRWLNQDAMKIYVDTAWTSGSNSHAHGEPRQHALVPLELSVNAGRYHGNTEPPRLYTKPGFLDIPPDPYYEELRATVHDGTSPSTFAARSKMRKIISVPFKIPPRGAKKITATVDYVPPKDARNSLVMYRGAMNVPASRKPGDVVNLKMRIQFRGMTMGAALGAKKLAANLAEHGRLFSTTFFRIGREATREMIEIPTGNCFPGYDLDKGYPCSQPCPPFPGMPNGFVRFSAIGQVYGSYTCKKGAPLEAWPET